MLCCLFSPPLPVCDSVESVNDGLFHTVQLLIQNRSLSLVVDSGAPKSLGKLARQPSVDHNTQLYIGGKQTSTHTHTQLQKCNAVVNFDIICDCTHMFPMHVDSHTHCVCTVHSYLEHASEYVFLKKH